MFLLLSIILPIFLFIAPSNVYAIQGSLDLSSAQTSVGKRFAKVFCDAKKEGLDSLSTEASLISYELFLKNGWKIIRKEKVTINNIFF